VKAPEEVSRLKVLMWSVPVVTGHFLVVVWHLWLLVRVQPGTPRFLPPILILVNLLPVAGLIVLAKGSQKLAATLVTVPLGVALVVGFGAHFLSSGNDNVLHMPPGALLLSFQTSAVLLMVLEAAGVLLGLQMFRLGKKKLHRLFK
jgi:hypothetical protein